MLIYYLIKTHKKHMPLSSVLESQGTGDNNNENENNS